MSNVRWETERRGTTRSYSSHISYSRGGLKSWELNGANESTSVQHACTFLDVDFVEEEGVMWRRGLVAELQAFHLFAALTTTSFRGLFFRYHERTKLIFIPNCVRSEGVVTLVISWASLLISNAKLKPTAC